MNAQTSSPVRFASHANNGLSDYIFYSRYARYDPLLGRRESYLEAVNRVQEMHRERFRPHLARRLRLSDGAGVADPADAALLGELLDNLTLEQALTNAFAAVGAKWVLPSMRSLQFGGQAIRRHPARLFNCAFSPVDRLEFFREFFYLLLAGTGCGFSVQREHVTRLPVLPPRATSNRRPTRWVVADNIEGWADALHELIRAHYEGYAVDFDYTEVRPHGAPLAMADGRAAGPEPLRRALGNVTYLLSLAAGRRLRPVEVYDLCMHVAQAVMGGSVRRSASICLFSVDDEEMLNAKTGNWQLHQPQRAASNNSAVLLRSLAREEQLRRSLRACRSHGEPGVYFSDKADYGCNPCGEAGLHPVVHGPFDAATIHTLRRLGYEGPLGPDTRLSGWQMCNLTTINGAAMHSAERFFTAAIHATVIGTLQAAYTDIDYLGPVTRYLNERDALLGVSICGFMDQPGVLFAPRVLERGARLCRAANEVVAAALGILPAARVTCVKPEGTASLLLGTAAGVHPHHALRYFRRVQAARADPVYQQFRFHNPEMTEPSALHPETDDCVTFPVDAPPHAGLRHDFTAVQFLEQVRLVQNHWVRQGERPNPRSPGLHHNVSHTCTVQADEWEEVAAYLWLHRAEFSGVAMLPDNALNRYPQVPVQAVTADDATFWNGLACREVNYLKPGSPASAMPAAADAKCSADLCDAI